MKRVLVVDDELAIGEAIRDVLEAEDYEVELALNGRDALVCIRRARPHAVLLDVMMPVMDGHAVLAELDGDEALRDLPVAVMSAGHNVRDRLGPDRPFLPKPFELDALLEMVAELVRRGGG